jgi:hypothetical protein
MAPRASRKPGTDTEFPAQFAGNWLSVPGFAHGKRCAQIVFPKTVKHPSYGRGNIEER